MTVEEAIASHLADRSDFIAAVVAAEIAAELRESNPKALASWLDERAETILAAEIAHTANSARARVRARAEASAFSEAAESGDRERLDAFSTFFVVDADNTRRRLGEMTGADHAFVANEYAATGKRALMLAAFHQAVARKVKKRRTADVMTVEEYERLLRSVTDPKSEAA